MSEEALINLRRISVLRRTDNVILARAFRSPIISDSADSRRLLPHALASAASPSLVRTCKVWLCPMGFFLSTRSGVVAGAVMSGGRHLSCAGIPRPRLLVRLSDVEWGAHLADEVASGLRSPEEAELLINTRELLVVEKGLLQFCHVISDSTVAVFMDNSTAVAYLRKQGGTRSPVLNSIAQRILHWAEEFQIVLAP